MENLTRVFVNSAQGAETALVFIHGFVGDRAQTWGALPEFIHEDRRLASWDILSLGYSSTLSLDITGIWSADARLAEVSKLVQTNLLDTSLNRYKAVILIAHSMGGLVAQHAIVENEGVRKRCGGLMLFGTPSLGLYKASLLSFLRLKRQVRDMAVDSPFIRALRQGWTERGLDQDPTFRFLTVAGELDQFVPPESSLGPFPELSRRVVPGNHRTMIKPEKKTDAVVELLCGAIGGTAAQGPLDSAKVAVELRRFSEVIETLYPRRDELDEQAAIDLALALDATERRREAIAFLQSRDMRDTDIFGVLAGRFKRRWLRERRKHDAEEALGLYRIGYSRALSAENHEQAFYHGINLAFFAKAFEGDSASARTIAGEVLEHCSASEDRSSRKWRYATEGEAQLILNQFPKAVDSYRHALRERVSPREAKSIQEQALVTADLWGYTEEEMRELGSVLAGLAASGEGAAV